MTRTKDNGQNRIWIELPYPATAARGQELADLANGMLKQLGVPAVEGGFGWSDSECRYTLNQGAGGFIELEDHGHWFNLDYLAKEAPIGADGWKARS